MDEVIPDGPHASGSFPLAAIFDPPPGLQCATRFHLKSTDFLAVHR